MIETWYAPTLKVYSTNELMENIKLNARSCGFASIEDGCSSNVFDMGSCTSNQGCGYNNGSNDPCTYSSNCSNNSSGSSDPGGCGNGQYSHTPGCNNIVEKWS